LSLILDSLMTDYYVAIA